MAVLGRIAGMIGFIRESVEIKKKTYKDISKELRDLYPEMRGISVRSIERFCCQHDIHATARLKAEVLFSVIKEAVTEVN